MAKKRAPDDVAAGLNAFAVSLGLCYDTPTDDITAYGTLKSWDRFTEAATILVAEIRKDLDIE